MGSTWRVSGPCCARVPWSLAVSRRPVNSRGGSSPGRTTSAPLKQHRACILDTARACGQSPDSPVEPNCPLKNAKKTVIFANKILSLAATKADHRRLVSCPTTDSWRHEQQGCLSLPHFEPLGSSAPVSRRFRLLAQAVFGYGMQAPFCLSGALVSCPVDKTPRELRARPYPNTDQGTGAQHRQVVSPDTGADEPRGVLLRPSSLQ